MTRILDWVEVEEISNRKMPYPHNEEIKKCDHKVRYATKYEAEMRLIQYRTEVIFSTMCSYWCQLHDSYHLGHSNKMGTQEIFFRDSMINVNLSQYFKKMVS